MRSTYDIQDSYTVTDLKDKEEQQESLCSRVVLEYPVVNISVFILHGARLSPAKTVFDDFLIDVAIGTCNVHTGNFRETRERGRRKL